MCQVPATILAKENLETGAMARRLSICCTMTVELAELSTWAVAVTATCNSSLGGPQGKLTLETRHCQVPVGLTDRPHLKVSNVGGLRMTQPQTCTCTNTCPHTRKYAHIYEKKERKKQRREERKNRQTDMKRNCWGVWVTDLAWSLSWEGNPHTSCPTSHGIGRMGWTCYLYS